MDHTLAIDFGTSNSSVYLLKQKEEMLPDENGNYLFPSYTSTHSVSLPLEVLRDGIWDDRAISSLPA